MSHTKAQIKKMIQDYGFSETVNTLDPTKITDKVVRAVFLKLKMYPAEAERTVREHLGLGRNTDGDVPGPGARRPARRRWARRPVMTFDDGW